MYNIVRVCEQQRRANLSEHKQIITGGNDPTISTPIKYSEYIHHTKPKTVYVSTAAERLAARGITFQAVFSPILVSLQFTNLKTFNMPREKVFSRIIVSHN